MWEDSLQPLLQISCLRLIQGQGTQRLLNDSSWPLVRIEGTDCDDVYNGLLFHSVTLILNHM